MIPLAETFTTADTSGAAVANTTTPTSLLPSGAAVILPSGVLIRIGQRLKIAAGGIISNIVTTPGTLTFDLKIGSIIVATSGALSLNIVAKTNTPWWLDWDLTFRAKGAGTVANLMHQGKWTSHSVIGAPAPTAGGAGVHMIPYNAAPAVGNGFDSTAAAILDLFVTWSIANAGNTIQLHQFDWSVLN